MDSSVVLATDLSTDGENELKIGNSLPYFNPSGQYIFFNMLPIVDSKKQSEDAVSVDLWSYRDSVLQSTQLLSKTQSPFVRKVQYTHVINISEKQIIRLEQKDEYVVLAPRNSKAEFVVVRDKVSVEDYWWNSFAQKSAYVVSLKDGSRRILKSGVTEGLYSFSPEGKYLVYFDEKCQNYFSFNLMSGERLNLTSKISSSLSIDNVDSELPGNYQSPIGIGGCW